MATRAVIYLRTAGSSPGTLDLQRERCAAAAAAHGLDVVAEYADQGVPGMALGPSLERLLREAGRGWQAVLVEDLQRFSRSAALQHTVAQRLAHTGVTAVYTVADGPLDAPGPSPLTRAVSSLYSGCRPTSNGHP